MSLLLIIWTEQCCLICDQKDEFKEETIPSWKETISCFTVYPDLFWKKTSLKRKQFPPERKQFLASQYILTYSGMSSKLSCVSYIQFFLLNCLGDVTQGDNDDLLWWQPYRCSHLYSSCLSNHSLCSHLSSITAQSLEEHSTANSIPCTRFISHGSFLSSTMSHRRVFTYSDELFL